MISNVLQAVKLLHLPASLPELSSCGCIRDLDFATQRTSSYVLSGGLAGSEDLIRWTQNLPEHLAGKSGMKFISKRSSRIVTPNLKFCAFTKLCVFLYIISLFSSAYSTLLLLTNE